VAGPELADLAREGVARYTLLGEVTYFNPAWAALHGLAEAATTTACGFFDLASSPEDAQAIWRSVLADGAWQGTIERRGLDGANGQLTVRLNLRRDAEGALLDIVEFSELGGLLRAGAAPRPIWQLEASELRYQQLIHYIPIPLVKVDSRAAGSVFERLKDEGVTDIAAYLSQNPELVELAKEMVIITSANAEASALFNTTSEAMVGPVRFLFEGTPDAAARVMTAHFNGARNHTEELKIRTFDGVLRDVVFLVTYPDPSEELDTTIIMMIDITERLATEAQLQRLEADYTHAARLSSLGELASSIAHEIKQPLSAILTNGETNLRWLAQAPPNVDKALELTQRIVDSAQRANDIIQRIQGMARKTGPARALLDFNSVVDEALRFVKYEMDYREVRIHRQLEPRLPLVEADRVQLQQVVVNLLMNALQALAEAPEARRDIQVTTRALSPDRVELQVVDGGAGIAPRDLRQVFESFFSTRTGGMGIGLSICRSIIANHGGEVNADNSQEGGARLTVTLPAAGSAQPH
jgi:two-component system sensor kinase FixL